MSDTEEIINNLSKSLDALMRVQIEQSNKRFEWWKIVLGLSPFIIGSAVSIVVAFTKLTTRIDQFQVTTEQIQTDENSRAVKVDYNFSIIKQKHPDMNFIETKNPK